MLKDGRNFHEDSHAPVVDITVVGAGLVGSALALALAKVGFKVALVDAGSLKSKKMKESDSYEPRVSAISEASRRMFVKLGVWEEVKAARRCSYENMFIWDGSGTGYIEFKASSVHAEVLGHIVENQILQNAILEQIELLPILGFPNTHLLQMERSDQDVWHLHTDDGHSIISQMLVGADGASSSVREMLGIETREWAYLHHALVTNVICQKPHLSTAWQRFTDHGPLAFLPLNDWQGKHWCSIVWSTLPEEVEKLMKQDDESFCASLSEAFEQRLGQVIDCSKRYSFPLRQQHAKTYVAERSVLLGDAAHTIHPLAGQGVNLGFMDVAVLVDVLNQSSLKGEPWFSKRVLQRFERRRMPDNLSMMAAMEGFQYLFQSNKLPVRWLRNQGMRLSNQLVPLKSTFIRHALGLNGHLPPLIREY